LLHDFRFLALFHFGVFLTCRVHIMCSFPTLLIFYTWHLFRMNEEYGNFLTSVPSPGCEVKREWRFASVEKTSVLRTRIHEKWSHVCKIGPGCRTAGKCRFAPTLETNER